MNPRAFLCRAWGVLAAVLALASLALPTPASAAPTDIANAPLISAAPTQVRPNLMFVLDDSGSMQWDYMPDWVNGHEGTVSGLHFCRRSDAAGPATATSSGGWNGRCCRGGAEGVNCLVGSGVITTIGSRPEPAFLASGFNGSAYNPATTYLLPRREDGSLFPSMTRAHTAGWTLVPNDAFGVQNTHRTDLTTQFPDTEWCTDHSFSNCVRNGNYVLPGRVMDGGVPLHFTVPRAVRAIGSGRIAVGDPRVATMQARAFGPHYYRIVPGEFCRGVDLRDCVRQATPSATHPHPAPMRWCNADAASRALDPAVGACRATRGGTFVHARFPAKIGGLVGSTMVYAGHFERIDIVPSRTTYPRAATRSDCAAATHCTYDEEMTNFANWWAYHRTRMQTMKSATALAFSGITDRLRVGYKSINNATGSDFLNLQTFTGTHRTDWFGKLLAARPGGITPLRRSLSTVGRLYAGRLNGTSLFGSTVAEPMQFSCQRNFTLLSTDGFWNEATTPQRIDGTAIGEVDGRAGVLRPFHDGTATPNTLSDVALYYWETDLRTPALANCSGPGPSPVDLCANNVPPSAADPATWQRMTTFTLGLGVPGAMQFLPDYRIATHGDFHAIATGATANPAAGVCSWQAAGSACTWPLPTAASLTTIDDLWHAAVNGRGNYFAASDPASLYAGITDMVAQIVNRAGTAAAATTSNPNVSAGDNFVFISNYTSGAWLGQLIGKTLDLNTGAVLDLPSDWNAASLLQTDTGRRIVFFDTTAPNGLRDFAWANLSATQRSYFELPHITATGRALTQFCSFGPNCLPPAAQSTAAGERLLDFVRGARGDEGSLIDTTRFFRERRFTNPSTGVVLDTVLGAIINSEAVYVRRVMFNYALPGYAAFKASTVARQPMVYVGSNGGMLHAFDALTGAEAWAFVPTMVMPNLYRLADKDYASRHHYFVDASPAVADVQIGGVWRTLLVGGLGAGGRGYFALDITDPAAPRALWEFTHANLGLSFGRAEIGRLEDGTWVVLLPSGYNNASPGDGRGRLFVLDAATGTLIRSIDTGVGTATVPSGMAHIRAWVDNADTNPTLRRVYGGDNLGNVWRFDINGNVGAPGFDAQRLATLRGPGAGAVQPVTSRPELGIVAGRTVVYVGTGRYLGVSDLADARVQSIYAIVDPLDTTDHGNPRTSGHFVQQTLTDSTCPAGNSICAVGEQVRTGSALAVNLATQAGWFVDLPVSLERVNTDPQLALGTLVVNSNIPTPDACSAGGDSYINFLDFRTGAPVANAQGVASVFLGRAIATRPTVVRLPGGRIISLTRMSDDSTVVRNVPVSVAGQATRRLSWRELAVER